jgi:hypothetical protein
MPDRLGGDCHRAVSFHVLGVWVIMVPIARRVHFSEDPAIAREWVYVLRSPEHAEEIVEAVDDPRFADAIVYAVRRFEAADKMVYVVKQRERR